MKPVLICGNLFFCLANVCTSQQVITGSHDFTIRLWDLGAGKSTCTLTHHKKSVRALTIHPELYMFASGAPDNIKQWKCPDGKFMQVCVCVCVCVCECVCECESECECVCVCDMSLFYLLFFISTLSETHSERMN